MRGERTLAAGASALAFVGGGAASGEGFGHADSAAAPNVVLLPPRGHRVYHAAFPAFPDFGGPEDRVSKARIHSFERLAGRRIVWAYFSNNWLRGRIRFPAARVRTISQAGRVPFIRMMARSEWGRGADPHFPLRSIDLGRLGPGVEAVVRRRARRGNPAPGRVRHRGQRGLVPLERTVERRRPKGRL